MRIGASTSNLYPTLTEDALSALLSMDFRAVEVFLNTPSEATPAFARGLRKQASAAGAAIVSVHSHCSLAEPFGLFSRYERRFLDYLEIYRGLFAAAAEMGAKFLVLHGDRAENPTLSPEEFAARYVMLYDAGQEHGVTLLQENVVRYRAQSPDFVRQMRALLGEKAQFVLDLKQCRRAGVSAEAMIEAMGDAIRHVHASDADATHDCLMPGVGTVDFDAIFRQLRTVGFDGDVMLELYRHNFGDEQELRQGHDTLAAFL